MSLKVARLKSAFHILKQQKILYKIKLILNAEDENSRFPSVFFFMYQVHERKKSCHIVKKFILVEIKDFFRFAETSQLKKVANY